MNRRHWVFLDPITNSDGQLTTWAYIGTPLSMCVSRVERKVASAFTRGAAVGCFSVWEGRVASTVRHCGKGFQTKCAYILLHQGGSTLFPL